MCLYKYITILSSDQDISRSQNVNGDSKPVENC